jgi:hypothetical protein
MNTRILTAASQKRDAQLFNVLSMIAVTLMPVFPIMLVWIGGSILVYASSAYHPNLVIREYIRYGGYRFYGLVGSLLAILPFSNELKRLAGGALSMWLTIWAISFLVVVPFGVRAVWRAGKEKWRDMSVETADMGSI